MDSGRWMQTLTLLLVLISVDASAHGPLGPCLMYARNLVGGHGDMPDQGGMPDQWGNMPITSHWNSSRPWNSSMTDNSSMTMPPMPPTSPMPPMPPMPRMKFEAIRIKHLPTPDCVTDKECREVINKQCKREVECDLFVNPCGRMYRSEKMSMTMHDDMVRERKTLTICLIGHMQDPFAWMGVMKVIKEEVIECGIMKHLIMPECPVKPEGMVMKIWYMLKEAIDNETVFGGSADLVRGSAVSLLSVCLFYLLA